VERIILILSPSRVSSACVERALSAAAGTHGELVAFYIIDATLSEDMQDRLHDLGFLGEAPSNRFMRAMRREHQRQGRRELERISGLARDRGVVCRTELLEGDFLTISLEIVERESADAVFVVRRDRPKLSRIVGGSAVSDLENSAPCEVVVHDEGDRD
jgi:nucleotide-binding universal stress UspA family protein